MRVLFVEDHTPTRRAVTKALEKRGIAVVPLAGPAGARAKAAECDVALVDLHLGDAHGRDLIAELQSVLPCIVFTIADDAESLTRTLAAGAAGYLLKDDPLDAVVRGLRAVIDGQTPLSPGVAGHLVDRFRPDVPQVSLTEREREVLTCLARGLTYGECAGALRIQLGTVQTHVKSLYAKLGVSSKTEAAAWAIRHGVVE